MFYLLPLQLCPSYVGLESSFTHCRCCWCFWPSRCSCASTCVACWWTSITTVSSEWSRFHLVLRLPSNRELVLCICKHWYEFTLAVCRFLVQVYPNLESCYPCDRPSFQSPTFTFIFCFHFSISETSLVVAFINPHHQVFLYSYVFLSLCNTC